jgi:predicted permease
MLMIALGYYLTYAKWFTAETGQLFARLAMSIAIPLYMIVSMTRTYSRQDLLQAGVAAAVPLLVMSASYCVGFATSFFVGVPERRRGAFQAMFFVSNSGFIGFPVNVALFGEAALPYAVIYYLVQTMLFWTIGAYGLSRDGSRSRAIAGPAAATAPPAPGSGALKNILSPPLLGAVAAILLIVTGVQLPTFIQGTFNSLGGMTTPLAMLFLGIAIYHSNLSTVRLSPDMWILVAARFLVAPAIAVLVTHFVPVPPLMRNVLVIEAAMPVMTQVSLAARAYSADAEYVAVMTAVTTVMAMFTIPAFFLLLRIGIL